MRQIYADLQATFPNASISLTSSDIQKQKWIAEVSGADYGIQYFYYDMQAASIALLASAYPKYNPAQSGKVAPIAYQTADGLTINLKTSFKSYCGRFLLDIYRFFRTFALTVWVILLSGQITEKSL